MSFEAVLGNTEFELVGFGVTPAVVTRCSASGHGVSVVGSGNSCNYCIKNVQTLGLRVYKLINFSRKPFSKVQICFKIYFTI